MRPVRSLDRHARPGRCPGARASLRRNPGTAAALKAGNKEKRNGYRLLTKRDLQEIRAGLERIDRISAISDENARRDRDRMAVFTVDP